MSQDFDDVECGKGRCGSDPTAGGGGDGDKNDDDRFLSELSPFSRRIARLVSSSRPSVPDKRASAVVTSAMARGVPSLAMLLTLPLLMWDGYPEEWGILNLYPMVRHIELVWGSLLHTSAWPVVVGTFVAAALMPSGGLAPPKYLPRSNGWADRLRTFLSAMSVNVSRSNWKMSLALSLVCVTMVLVNMCLQMGVPGRAWNPFIWGWYNVYLPDGIAPAMEGACLNFGEDGAAHQPLCLSETKWDELSSGQLSSGNPDDVLTVRRGLDYVQHESGGIVINVLARDVAESISALKQNLEGLLPFFKDSKNKLSIVIFENDSNDGTREIFQSWAEEESGREEPRYTVDLISCGPKNPNCELGIMDRYDNMNLFINPNASGVGKLGEFRQSTLEYIMGQERYRDYSHMVVLDVDLGTSISPLGLLHTLGLEDGVARDHVVASSSSQVWPGASGTIIPPYDLSAFRPKETKANEKVREMHRSFCELTPAGDRWRNMCGACSPMQLFMIQSAHDPTNHHEQPYEVVSAFNGLATYPLGLIRERGALARYDAGDDGQRCEHVGFHMSLGRNMYVNPKWSMNLKPNKPGGPTGMRAIKTLTFAILGRPKVMLCIGIGDLLFFFLLVYPCWIIGRALKSLILLFGLPHERNKRLIWTTREGAERRDLISAFGVDV